MDCELTSCVTGRGKDESILMSMSKSEGIEVGNNKKKKLPRLKRGSKKVGLQIDRVL